MRQFMGIDLGRELVPHETTICKVQHLLEAHQLGQQLLARIGENLTRQGLQVSRGSCGCDHHQCPQFDEESDEGAGPRDARDEE